MISFIKVPPTTYVLQYQGGKIKREGAGLSFLYWGPTSTIVGVPIASTDFPFAFQEATADFQTATIQGQLTYRVADPKRLSSCSISAWTAILRSCRMIPRSSRNGWSIHSRH